jgi:hypothetical protein
MDTAAMHDLAQKLGENWPCVVWAYPAGLPTMFNAATGQSVKLLQSIGVLDVNLKMWMRSKRLSPSRRTGKKLARWQMLIF